MICISIADKKFSECKELVRKEQFVELRLDLLDLDPDEVRDIFSLPYTTIATCRPGKFSDEYRLELLTTAIQSGANFVDIELEMPSEMKEELVGLADRSDCEVIISYHNYEITPPEDELDGLISQCKSEGADIVKIACQVNNRNDNVRLLTLLNKDEKLVIVGMGKEGMITRIAAPILGSIFTYASTGKGDETASGQLGKEEMMKVFGLLDIDLE